MTLKEIKARVRYGLGIFDDTWLGRVSEDYLVHMVNQAARDVRIDLEDVHENWYFNTTADQQAYTLPADFLVELEVWTERNTTNNFQGYRVEPVDYRNLVEPSKRLDDTPDADSPIERYAISNENVFYINPVPSTAKRLDIWYLPIPSDMDEDTDEPDMRSIFHELIPIKAREKIALEIPQLTNLAGTAIQQYREMLPKYKALSFRRQPMIRKVKYQGRYNGR